MGLPERIRTAREAKDWTRERLAVYASVSASTIGRIERGQLRPRAGTIIALARALGLSAEELAAEVGLVIHPMDPNDKWAQ
jgi:transcriptional regulator with XRE-family HTH domain